jgi:hypothetical protein
LAEKPLDYDAAQAEAADWPGLKPVGVSQEQWEEAVEVEKEFIRERVEFDCAPGKAVKNLMEALGAEGD